MFCHLLQYFTMRNVYNMLLLHAYHSLYVGSVEKTRWYIRAPVLMKSSVKIVFIIMVSIALVAVVSLSLDYWKNRPRIIHCDDGERQTADRKRRDKPA